MDTLSDRFLFGLAELEKADIPLVGKKCAHLGELTRLGAAVPPGFAISVAAYQRFMAETGAGEEIRAYVKGRNGLAWDYAAYQSAGRDLRRIVEAKNMPPDMEALIRQRYAELCARCDSPDLAVAVRSSGPVSLPGQFDTYLNVRSADAVVRQVIRVWGSTFNTQAVAFRIREGLPLENSPVGVAVLKMVNAKSAGVIFTRHPTTGDTTKMVIEGAWGLGESVVGGGVAPDRFVVDKEDGRLCASQIGPKTSQVVYLDQGTGTVDVPAHLQNEPCLSGEEIELLVKAAGIVERHFGVPQDIEWAVDRDLPHPDNVYLVQARAVTGTVAKKEKPAEQIIDLMLRNVFRR
ncbi:MAG: PEP/pyruvate-binding domain-containing protein [Peptococcaceae bacterium]|jgi:pyruvate,water dikinase|nr:PEP/pyruvate-binding domain-containing protein [Peptococcaceae bacterium]